MQEMKAQFAGIEVVSSNQYAGPTRDTAKAASENLLNRFGNDIQGVFTPNESSAVGMLLALQDMKLAGKIIFVGFDSSPSFFQGMKKKKMQGTGLQNPFNFGYLRLRTKLENLSC